MIREGLLENFFIIFRWTTDDENDGNAKYRSDLLRELSCNKNHCLGSKGTKRDEGGIRDNKEESSVPMSNNAIYSVTLSACPGVQ